MKNKSTTLDQVATNADWQGVDKDPKEEKGKSEPVEMVNLKGKKVDADPQDPEDDPVDIEADKGSA
jgi:hypothetical protein